MNSSFQFNNYFYFIILLFINFSLSQFDNTGYSTITGYGNNIEHPLLQTVATPYIRTVNTNSYSDGVGEINSNLPNERYISNRIFAAEPVQFTSPALNDLHIAFGQMITHDIQLAQNSASTLIDELENPGEVVSIPIPLGDPWFDPNFTGNKTFEYVRIHYKKGTGSGTNTTRTILNRVTPLLDLSTVYGSTDNILQLLRNKTHPAYLANGYTLLDEKMLSFNTENVPISNPFNIPNNQMYMAGHPEVNQNPFITVMQALFLNNHNRIAENLAREHQEWSQEKLFWEARRYNIAQYQAICFNEYIPSLIGNPLPEYERYDDSVTVAIDVMFNAAFRFAHSSINPTMFLANENRDILTSIRFRDGYYRTEIIHTLGLSNLIRGLSIQPQQVMDNAYVSDIRNFLFGRPGDGGIDLAALCVFRSRDFGLPLYNDARIAYGLDPIDSFDEIISNFEIAQALEEIYGHPDNAESIVVGLSEDSASGIVGPLFASLIEKQMIRTRAGDRYYFENEDAGFTEEEIASIAITTISDIILLNSDVKQIPCSAFFSSPDLDCGEAPPVAAPTYDNSAELLNGDIILSWQIEEENILFSVEANTGGWVGIAIASNPGNMVDADAMIGSVSGGSAIMADYKITARNVGCDGVCPDTEQGGSEDLFDISGSESGGKTFLQWSRALDTGDGTDEPISDDGNPTAIVFAMSASNSDSLGYHQGKKGAAEINFFTGDSTLTDVDVGNQGAQDRLTVHGVLMFFGWCVVFPLGVVAVRFCRKILPRWWFRLHMFLQYFGVIVIIVALIFAVEAVADLGDRKHINNAHAIMGIISMSFAIIVPALGQATAVMYESPKSVPIFPDKVHALLGYLSPFVAYATIFLGLYEKDTDWYWYFMVALWIFLITIFYWTAFIIQYIYTMYENKKNKKANEAISGDEDEDSWSSDEE